MNAFFVKKDSGSSISTAQEANLSIEDESIIRPCNPSLCIEVPDAVSVLNIEIKKKKIEANIFNKKSFQNLCKELCPDLNTEDVLNNNSFIDGISNASNVIIEYMKLKNTYKDQQVRVRKDKKMYAILHSLTVKTEQLKMKMVDASKIKVNSIQGLSNVIISAKAKELILTDILTLSISVKEEIKNSDIINKIRKRVTQRISELTKNKIKETTEFKDYNLKCLNTSLSWEKAFLNIENCNIADTLVHDVKAIASDIQAEFCYPVNLIPIEIKKQIIYMLILYFPVILVEGKDNSVLIDMTELILDKDAFVLILKGGCENNENEEELKEHENIEKTTFIGPKKRPGRIPLYIKFPSLVDCATKFIKEHSYTAHVRRRETTGTGVGVTLKDIQEHLLENVPGLKNSGGIHRDTIHRLTVAPRKNTIRSHRFKGLIDARVPGKKNQYREDSANQHFLFARVAYREEFVTKFQKEAQFYSCDDMNKLRMGPATAVSRYHQIFRFFMTNDAPNVGDHDFPNPGYLLVPSGYMALSSKFDIEETAEEYINEELNDVIDFNMDEGVQQENYVLHPNNTVLSNLVKDKLRRCHYPRLCAGPSIIKLRSCKFGQTSGMTHANDILPALKAQVAGGKGVAFVKVDNGSDWNLHSLVNNLYMGRVWKVNSTYYCTLVVNRFFK